MAGGLIQIVTYGSQDLYLTGTPEITFFKVVYRRYTNFSIENVPIPFDDPTGFGLRSAITIPKNGDLVHKTYLEITLPEVTLQRLTTSNNLLPALQQAEANFQIVTAFMQLNWQAYTNAIEIYDAENITLASQIIQQVDSVFAQAGTADTITAFQNLLTTTQDAPFTYDEVSMKIVADAFNADDSKNAVFTAMTTALDKSQKTQQFYFNQLVTLQDEYADQTNPNIKFAWVNRIGHTIIDEILITIGGSVIDRHFGDWLNIWYELTAKRDLEPTYFKLIGNVEPLTSFDRNTKPSYLLRVPMQFWFCRFSGLALPLVALEYHDVTITVKFKKIGKVAYIEADQQILFNKAGTTITLDEVPAQLGLDIQAMMSFDYIYLDIDERRRFAQASHEYLIDQLQILELPIVSQKTLQVNLNKFVLPSREIIWVAQKVSYTKNPDGTTQTQFDNYSLTDTNMGNPIAYSTLQFHSYERIARFDGNYFNYVQPYQHHQTTPSDGINMYSFALFPEEFQPSGSANFSRLSRINLTLEFDPSLLQSDGSYEQMYVRIYTRNVNILRVFTGMASPAATFGAG